MKADLPELWSRDGPERTGNGVLNKPLDCPLSAHDAHLLCPLLRGPRLITTTLIGLA
jgi:hypothetical protein